MKAIQAEAFVEPVQADKAVIVYPESDGRRMADNTEQARWIMVLFGNIAALLRDVCAFVAADLIWYAREGFPEESNAPDVFVAFGRPRGKRGSYKQWEEDDVAPQVVFEIWSPNNTQEEMERKDAFYSDHGVEEYYIYDPERNHLAVFLRKGTVLRYQWFQTEFTSPLLGIRFDLTGDEMQVFYPDGRRFLTFAELEAERASIAEQLETTRTNLQTTETNLRTAETNLRNVQQTIRRLAELGRKARSGQATPDEIAEVERLENQSAAPST